MNWRCAWLILALSCRDDKPSGEPGGTEEPDADTDADTDSDTDADADSDTDADTGEEPCDAVRFSDADAAWSLPELSIKDEGLYNLTWSSSSRTCQDGSLSGQADWTYDVFDITGDRVPDLVTLIDECVGEEVGTEYWIVNKGTGSGFEEAGTPWSLPQPSVQDAPLSGLNKGHYTRTCQDGSLEGEAAWYYYVFDIDGDRLLDLVTLLDECAGPDVGTKHWIVNKGTSSGFEETDTVWTLPEPPLQGAYLHELSATFGALTCQDGSFEGEANWFYQVFDLTGDGALDLVTLLDECAGPDVGTKHFIVNKGTSSGFEEADTVWSLPEAYLGSRNLPVLSATYTSSVCPDGSLKGEAGWSYSIFDLTGDRVLDLVSFFDDCVGSGAEVGSEYWLVHAGTSSGFADKGAQWSLPPSPVSDASLHALSATHTEQTCPDGSLKGEASWHYSVVDIDGDGLLDLVTLIDECAGSDVGTKRWIVNRGTSAGFEEEAAPWELPDPPVPGSPLSTFTATYTSQTCPDGSLSGAAAWFYSVFDLTGDGALDLVTFFDECGDEEVGRQRWIVNAGACDP